MSSPFHRSEFENFQSFNSPSNEDDNFNNYQINFENNIELQKAIAKLEDLLANKHVENENLIRMHNDFKELHERLRKECQELNTKLFAIYNEKNQQEKKYQTEIEKIKNHFDKQREIYESQIFKLSQQDTESLKIKITADLEMKQKYLLNQKEIQIQNNQEQIFELKRKFELKVTEFEAFRNEANNELQILKENHKNEIKEFLFKIQLLNEKAATNVDKESFRNMKNELESYRRNFSELQNEILQLRKEKEFLILEKNETKINLLKELEEEKLKSKMVFNEIEKNSFAIKNFENEINSLKSKIEEKSEEVKFLSNEKFQNLKELRIKDTELETAKSEIRLLRQKIETRERENENLINLTHEKDKQRFLTDKYEKEEYQKKIEELQKNLREVQIEFKNFYSSSNEELHCAKRDFYMISEEKRNLIRRISEMQEEIQSVREENLKKSKTVEYYEKEYKNLEEEYRNLSIKESESNKIKLSFENELNKKSEEISSLNSLLKNFEKEKNDSLQMIKVEFKTKMKILLNKKNHYKNQKLAEILKNLKMKSMENDVDEMEMRYSMEAGVSEAESYG